jgi:hypothetical protein
MSFPMNDDFHPENNFYPEEPLQQKPKTGNGMGIASLVLGICSIVICCCYGIGIIPSVLALIFGILQQRKNPNGIATAGIVLGIVGILCNLVFLIYMIIFFSYASDSNAWQQFFEEFSEEFSDSLADGANSAI